MNASVHILLVEDSPTDVLLTQDALQEWRELDVTVADRLSKALELLCGSHFDVILLDLGLPDSQSLDTFVTIRQACHGIPVVIMTASDDDELALRAIHEGAQDYLVKGQIREKMLPRTIRYAIERKRTEEALQRAHDELEMRVEERTTELTKAIQVKDNFLATMSHDLRTPLNAIIGFTGILLMRLPGPLNTEQEQQLRTVQNSATHLLSLINDVLDLVKIDSGKMELRLEPVVCQSVVQEVLTTLRPLAEAKGLKFLANVPDHDLVVQTEPRALLQILQNLTDNAIKFTDQGEVLITIARRFDQDDAVTFDVIDTGSGIRPEDQARLFQAFVQVGATGKSRQQGTGLGLHLSRKLAALLGGEICLQSEFGKGSTFTLVLRKNASKPTE